MSKIDVESEKMAELWMKSSGANRVFMDRILKILGLKAYETPEGVRWERKKYKG